MDARKRIEARGKHKQKRSKAEILITGGILAASSVMAISLFAYFRPFSSQDVAAFTKSLYSYASEQLDTVMALLSSRIHPEPEESLEEALAPEEESQETVPYMARSEELGDISDMTAEPVFPLQEDAIYSCMLDTPLGPLFYYNQGDLRWKEYLYGGSDRMAKYGCGPTCVAMIINSFTLNSVTPVEMADWSAQNGYYARHSGSYHGLIPGSLSSFGLQVDSVTDRTVEHASELLRTGHILVALMGKGSLTQNGHFIIIAQLAGDGNVYIADPANYENSTKVWDLQLLMDELKGAYDSGGPLWAVSFPSGTQETGGS
ncbi:MAG: hypothetical protein HFG70_00645 [Hungatella sp.]|nr:hypothetical protein [Hungatella sp.]